MHICICICNKSKRFHFWVWTQRLHAIIVQPKLWCHSFEFGWNGENEKLFHSYSSLVIRLSETHCSDTIRAWNYGAFVRLVFFLLVILYLYMSICICIFVYAYLYMYICVYILYLYFVLLVFLLSYHFVCWKPVRLSDQVKDKRFSRQV